MTNLARSIPTETSPLGSDAGDFSDDVDQQILRVESIGRRLFEALNCIKALEGMPPNSLDARDLIALVKAAFCRKDPLVGRHRAVVGSRIVNRACAMSFLEGLGHAGRPGRYGTQLHLGR